MGATQGQTGEGGGDGGGTLAIVLCLGGVALLAGIGYGAYRAQKSSREKKQPDAAAAGSSSSSSSSTTSSSSASPGGSASYTKSIKDESV